MSAVRARALIAAAALVAAVAIPASVQSAARAEAGCTPDFDAVPALSQPAQPVGTGSCTGARPGAHVSSPLGRCTANFVFEGSDGHRYLGIAGHCILKYDYRDRTWPAGDGPWAKIDERIAGEFAYASLTANHDFALIRLDPAFPWSPAMIHFGGPTGMYTAHEQREMVVHHHGNAMVYGNVSNRTSHGVGPMDVQLLPSRSGVVVDTSDPYWVGMYSGAIWGDSGSGVITEDGLALGTLVQMSTEPEYGTNWATRVDLAVDRAESVMGITLTLQTAPLRTAP